MTEFQENILNEISIGEITNYYQFRIKMDVCDCELDEDMIFFLTDIRNSNVYSFMRESFSIDSVFDDIILKNFDNFKRLIMNHGKWCYDSQGHFLDADSDKVNIIPILKNIFKRRPGLVINYYLKNESAFVDKNSRKEHETFEFFLIKNCEKHKEKFGKYYDMILEKRKQYNDLFSFMK